jgi:hypothetical protein
MTKEKQFELWAYDMWEENCEERAAFKQKCMSFTEYVEKNNAYLRMRFDAESDPLYTD